MVEYFNSRQKIVKKGDVLFDEPTKIIHVEFDALGPGVYEVTIINNGDYVVNKIKYEDTNRMDSPICYCGSIMKIDKRYESSGMDGSYCNWILTCPKCGITKEFAADNFYGREYLQDERAVINNWNQNRRDKKHEMDS